MRVAYLDCFSGISGDMTLGALIDIGLDFQQLQRDLANLSLDEYELYQEKVVKNGISATKVTVIPHEGHVHRHLADIQDIINKSTLPEPVKQKSLEIFQRLAEAEAKVHGVPIEQIHFHEVGAVDAIVDIVGAVIGFWRLGIEKVFASSVHIGKGFVKAAHGIMPVPAPATFELLKEVPVYARDIEGELVTPTGAAILTTFSKDFGPIPEMKIERVGYGAGEMNLSIPNVVRLTLGEVTEAMERSCKAHEEGIHEGQALTLEVNIDDMNPELYDFICEKLFKAGAMDVYLQNIHMKKNRPACILTVQMFPQKLEAIRKIIFEETTAIGFRVFPVTKYMLRYEIIAVETKYGLAHAKISRYRDSVCTISPEYEDCRRLAQETNCPLKEIYDAVKDKAREAIL